MPVHRTWLEISSEALGHNVRMLKSCLANDITFFAIVKGNAYGHGLKEVVRILDRQGVRHFGTDSLEEALIVRTIAPQATIVTLGFIPDDHLHQAVQADIQMVHYNLEQLRRLNEEARKQGKTASVHLKVETGTARQGIFPEDLPGMVRQMGSLHHLRCVGISTHFARAEELNASVVTQKQTDLFYGAVGQVAEALPDLSYVHAACSAAILSHSKTHGTAVRAGLSMYGLWPSEDVELNTRSQHLSLRLQPVLSWYTRVAQVKDYPAGTPVGYGGREVLNRPTRVAVIPVGYYDRYDRGLSTKADVLIRGHRCKVLGNICMNMMMVDASRVPSIEYGDRVTLIGQDGAQRIHAEELAQKNDTISWEIVTRIAQHLPRVVV